MDKKMKKIDRVKPDLFCESFYAQMIASTVGIPALLGNPQNAVTVFHFPLLAFLFA